MKSGGEYKMRALWAKKGLLAPEDPGWSEVGIASRPGGDANMVFSVPMLDDSAFYRVTVSDR